jgi:hypothetical protein
MLTLRDEDTKAIRNVTRQIYESNTKCLRYATRLRKLTKAYESLRKLAKIKLSKYKGIFTINCKIFMQ